MVLFCLHWAKEPYDAHQLVYVGIAAGSLGASIVWGTSNLVVTSKHVKGYTFVGFISMCGISCIELT